MDSSNKPQGLSKETWKEVVRAIEDSIPLYDHVNSLISFGKAQVARIYAVENMPLKDGSVILDSGIGPGTTSRLILIKFKPSVLIGLDGSVKQLETARENLRAYRSSLHLVNASFEYLPFRDNILDGIITCYALRDSLAIAKAISEYSRACGERGIFVDVDIGKSDNLIKRALSIVYVKYVMPSLAKIAIHGQIVGNPWRMIAPTYDTLPTNVSLTELMKKHFAKVQTKEFLNDGIIVIIGRKS